MEEKKVLTIKRQKELVRINQVLAGLVVVLSFFSGYLITVQQSWIASRVEQSAPLPISHVAQSTNPLVVSVATSSALTSLLRQARYERVIHPGTISKADLMAVIWAAQGQITDWGERTVPSYKATFPIQLIVYAKDVQDVFPGWYHFRAKDQSLVPFSSNESGFSLPLETVPGLAQAPAFLLASMQPNIPASEMVWNEAGGIAQNTLLMVRERGLVTYLIPGGSQKPYLWIMPFGHEKVVDTSVKEAQ